MGFLGVSLGGGWIGYLPVLSELASSSRWPARSAARFSEPESRSRCQNGDAGSGAQCAAPLAALGRHDDAVARYDRAIAARKNFVEVHQAKGERGLLLSRAKM